MTIRPQILVCLGATAAQSLLGSSFRVTEGRGQILDVDGLDPRVTATIHPSAILRAPDGDRAREEDGFVRDLATARMALSQRVKPSRAAS